MPPPPSSSSQYDGNNQANQEVAVYKSINISINALLNVLPKAAIIGSTCQLIVSFLPYWLSGNVLAEGLSYVCFADTENDAGLLHFWVQECNNEYISLFHCLKGKKPCSWTFYHK